VDSTKSKLRTLVQALRDERETLKEREHPNIVRYLVFEEDEGVLNALQSILVAFVLGSVPFT